MALVLVCSSLALRRLPRGSLLKLIVLWIVIFMAVAALVYAYQTVTV